MPIIAKVSPIESHYYIYSAILKGFRGQLTHLTILMPLFKHRSNRRIIYSREDVLTMRITREVEGPERECGGGKG